MGQSSSMEIDSLSLPLHVTASANLIRGLLARPHLFVMHLSTAWALPYDDRPVLTKTGWDDGHLEKINEVTKTEIYWSWLRSHKARGKEEWMMDGERQGVGVRRA